MFNGNDKNITGTYLKCALANAGPGIVYSLIDFGLKQ